MKFKQTAMLFPNQFLWLSPKDGKVNAKKFFDKYHGIFHPKAVGTMGGNPAVVMTDVNNKQLIVENRAKGIFINGKLFAEEW